ncbi:MAG: hypothetical protein ACPLSY_11905 [Moorellaceae bacterium]
MFISILLILVEGCIPQKATIFAAPEEALFSISQEIRIIDQKPLGNGIVFFARDSKKDYIVRLERAGNGWVIDPPGISSSPILPPSTDMHLGRDAHKSEDVARTYTVVYGLVYNPNITAIEVHFLDNVIMRERVKGEGFLVVRAGFYPNRDGKIRVIGLDDEGNKVWEDSE